MAEIVLNAEKREKSTQSVLNELRKNGYVPGTFYSKEKEAFSFAAHNVDVNRFVFTSETNIINLKINDDKEELRGIIKDVQFDPITDKVTHIDILGLTAGQTLQLEIPVTLTGDAVGVKEGGSVQQSTHKLDVECLPRHIPEQIEIDVTDLSIGDSIHVKDLNLENVKILNAETVMLVSVIAPRAIEEPEETLEDEILADEPAEPEVIGKGKSEDENEGDQ
ncbi:MAG: 50S ribosomal protein L25 [Ignavibacteriae bacterium]|jgi:large subunit ribosomal protein L25|nr:50S ribosomal protein L25 [Ignavibacteriota bacterium]NOG96996.1 50S ribosomal protein L25 [Ignavibacteriota bacterium]